MAGRKGTLLVLLLSAMMIFSIVGVGNAAVYSLTYDDPNNPKIGSSIEFSFDFTALFNPATEPVTSASLDLYLYDDSTSDGNEAGELKVLTGYFLWWPIYEIEGTVNVINGSTTPTAYTIPIDDHLNMLSDGDIFFKLSSDYGDFRFDRATLNVNTSNPVPEPGTMMLLGSGLVGLAGFGRKKFRK